MEIKRQLALPLPQPRADRPLKRAKRDFTKDEFVRALARNGVTCGSMDAEVGLYYIDSAGRKFEAIVRRNPLRIARRATLARILRGGGGRRDRKGPQSRIAARARVESRKQGPTKCLIQNAIWRERRDSNPRPSA
jgi:hypothetical protein